MGTQVRLHLFEGDPVDVGLLDIRDVSTWVDLATHVARRLPLYVEGSRRMVFAGGSIAWAEAITDPTLV